MAQVRDAGGGAVFEAATSLGAGDESRHHTRARGDCPRLARVDPCVACGRHDAGEDEDGDAVASLAEEQRIAEMKVRERGSASCLSGSA